MGIQDEGWKKPEAGADVEAINRVADALYRIASVLEGRNAITIARDQATAEGIRALLEILGDKLDGSIFDRSSPADPDCQVHYWDETGRCVFCRAERPT